LKKYYPDVRYWCAFQKRQNPAGCRQYRYVYVVFAVEPYCDFLLIDQYLAVCESHNIDAALVLNKTDLPQSDSIEKELLDYQNLGYPLYRVSARAASGWMN